MVNIQITITSDFLDVMISSLQGRCLDITCFECLMQADSYVACLQVKNDAPLRNISKHVHFLC